MKPIIIGFDVDDVLAALCKEWFFQYNVLFNDSVKQEDVRSWDVSKYLKKASKDQLFSLLSHPEFYTHVEVIPGALETVNWCRSQYNADGYRKFRVVFVTSCLTGTMVDQKFEWLIRNGFFGYVENDWETRKKLMKDYFPVSDKSLVRTDLLIDDNVDNCLSGAGMAILFNAHHNEDISVACDRAVGHEDLRSKLNQLYDGQALLTPGNPVCEEDCCLPK